MDFDTLWFYHNYSKKWDNVLGHGETKNMAEAKAAVEALGFTVIYGYRDSPPEGSPDDLHTDMHSGGVFFKHAER